MKQIAKLKDEARRHEQKEEWDKAIQAYTEVLRVGEAGDGAELDLPLYNRVGDLYVRLGRAAEAVKYYEQAADKYAEAGLYNNAIALCNKALRYDAGRVELLKKLGQFSASQGFFTDARRWYLEYCERMSKRGAMEEAFQALSELADVHDDPEIRELLARQLKDHGRTEQAIREYKRAYAKRKAGGDQTEAEAIRAEIHALDPNVDLELAEAPAVHGHHAARYEELPGFLDEPAVPSAAAPVAAAPPPAEAPAAAPPEVAFDGPVQESTLDVGTIEIESHAVGFAPDTSFHDYGTIDLEAPVTAHPSDLDVEPLDIGIEPSMEFQPPVEEPPAATEAAPEAAALPGVPEAVEADEDAGEFFELPVFDLGEAPTEETADQLDAGLPSFEDEIVEAESAEPLPLIEETSFAQELVEEEAPTDDTGAPLPLSFDYADEPSPADEAATEEITFEAEPDLAAEPVTHDFPSLTFDLAGFGAAQETEEPGPAFEFEEAAPDVEPPPEPEPEPFFEPAGAEAPESFFEPAAPEAPESFFEPAAPDAPESFFEPAAAEALDSFFEPAAPEAPEPLFEDLVEEFPEPVFEEPPEVISEPEFEPAPPTTPEPEYHAPPAFEAETANEAAGPALTPQPPASAAPSRPQPQYVDLSSFLLDDEAPVESTRFVVAEQTPTGDEERDFADMLKQFKAKVAETIPKEDAGSHYDLGLAFKEMGLIDEAIAEFQTALRGGEEKLKVYEELGNCFVQKQQYSVAVTILNRAMQMPHEDEAELLGVYYNLGRAHQELGQFAEARAAFERIISVDIGFMDTSQRLAQL